MIIHERFLPLGGEVIFIRHTEICSSRPTLLFVHGLGESSLCFGEAFSSSRLTDFNLVAADNVGYGRSSQASDGNYSFAAQVRRLQGMAASICPGEITLVGHSLGGILGTLWADHDRNRLIQALVNVEGNLTAADASFSERATVAFEQFRRHPALWSEWFFSEFAENQLFDRLEARSMRRYYASLLFARPEAFLANALEIMELGAKPLENGETVIGKTYRCLEIPRIYLWGMESLSDRTRIFLAGEGLLNRGFAGAGHWPMIDACDDFYPALADFIEQTVLAERGNS